MSLEIFMRMLPVDLATLFARVVGFCNSPSKGLAMPIRAMDQLLAA
jgi:hypothetical protein